MKLASGYKWSSPRLCPWPNIIHYLYQRPYRQSSQSRITLRYNIFGLDPQKTFEIAASLQNDISGIVDWTKTWLMELNISKFKAMHVDKKNPGITYTMNSYSDNLTRTLKILLIFKTFKNIKIVQIKKLFYKVLLKLKITLSKFFSYGRITCEYINLHNLIRNCLSRFKIKNFSTIFDFFYLTETENR